MGFAVWGFGGLEVWRFGDLGVWGFGGLGVWGLLRLAFVVQGVMQEEIDTGQGGGFGDSGFNSGFYGLGLKPKP